MPEILDILEAFYITLWLITFGFCWRVGTTNTLLASVFLSALFWAIWRPNLFDHPSEMISFHFLILMALITTPRNIFWRVFFIIVMLMAALDMIWMKMPDIEPFARTVLPEMPYLFPYHFFWWQSALIVFWVLLCFYSIWLCKLTHKVDEKNRGNGDGYIWAFVGNFLTRLKNN